MQSSSTDCCYGENAVVLEENADLADMAGDARGQFCSLLQADMAGAGLPGKYEPNVTRTAFHRSVNCLRRGQSTNFDFDLHWRARERLKLPEARQLGGSYGSTYYQMLGVARWKE